MKWQELEDHVERLKGDGVEGWNLGKMLELKGSMKI